MTKEGPPIELDVILKQLGAFGKFNIINYGLMLIPIFLAGMYGSVFVFEATDINYRCKIKECEGLNNSEWLVNAIPVKNDELAKCSRYSLKDNASSDESCNADAFDRTNQLKCDELVYSDEDSAVRDFNLGCQDWKRTLIGTVRNSGLFISLPLTGIISDRFGRKRALVMAALMSGIFGLARSFSVSYVMMLILEFFESALGGGINSTSFVLAVELVAPKGRVLGTTVLNLISTLGMMSLPAFSWWFQDWRKLLRIIYTPAILVFSYLWLLNESVRWLLSKGRNVEAAEILLKAAKMNNVDISEELNPLYKLEVKSDTQEVKKEEIDDDKAKVSTFKQVIRSRVIRTRVCMCSFLWITCTFVYYGLSINSVSLGGNKYMNFMLVSFMDIPGSILCLIVLDRFGRKKILSIFYIMSACLCICQSFVPEDPKWLSLALYLSGKLCIVVAYSSLYIYVSEVFPTSVRQSLLATCSSLGRVGSTLAPLTPLLALYSNNLPAILFGTLALVASGMVLILPETINMPLPDTIEAAEQLATRS
ncbi:organic cation transporter protein-like [Choristoneura fumiferana]|uniref:organic cation transporter protein-like n=1 Tax=Choristoneura fumiferana TaxID=7141 RepID=UPI003D153A93